MPLPTESAGLQFTKSYIKVSQPLVKALRHVNMLTITRVQE